MIKKFYMFLPLAAIVIAGSVGAILLFTKTPAKNSPNSHRGLRYAVSNTASTASAAKPAREPVPTYVPLSYLAKHIATPGESIKPSATLTPAQKGQDIPPPQVMPPVETPELAPPTAAPPAATAKPSPAPTQVPAAQAQPTMEAVSGKASVKAQEHVSRSIHTKPSQKQKVELTAEKEKVKSEPSTLKKAVPTKKPQPKPAQAQRTAIPAATPPVRLTSPTPSTPTPTSVMPRNPYVADELARRKAKFDLIYPQIKAGQYDVSRLPVCKPSDKETCGENMLALDFKPWLICTVEVIRLPSARKGKVSSKTYVLLNPSDEASIRCWSK